VSYARLEEFAKQFSFQLSFQALLCRSFLTGIIRPVSPYLQGKTCKRLGLRQLLQKSADRYIPTGIDLQD
jgi:hypothetical protein